MWRRSIRGWRTMATSYCLTFRRFEPLSWLGHLDTMRLFERAFRRADLPLLWSQGFNPRPEIVFALPTGLGVEAEADYCCLTLTEPLPVAAIVAALAKVFPPGVEVYRAQVLDEGGESAMSAVEAADYRYELKGIGPIWTELWQRGEPLIVQKRDKKKQWKDMDIRPLILAAKTLGEDLIKLHVRAGSVANFRPDLLLQLLEKDGRLTPATIQDGRMIRERLYLSESFDARLKDGL